MDSNFHRQLEETKKIFGQRLREIRVHFNNSGTHLAKELGTELNVTSRSLISRWETGGLLPNGQQLFGIHKVFEEDVSLDYLFGISNERPAFLAQKPDAKTYPRLDRDPIARFFWNEDATEEFEKSAEVVWVATPNFTWEHQSDKWSKVIFENITKRHEKSYYYLYKHTEDNEKKLMAFTDRLQRAMGNNWRNVVHFVVSNSDEFPYWAEHVLYNASGKKPRCIMILPHGYGEREIGGYNLEFTWAMTFDFGSWFSALWNKNLQADAKKDWVISWPENYTPSISDDHAGHDTANG